MSYLIIYDNFIVIYLFKLITFYFFGKKKKINANFYI